MYFLINDLLKLIICLKEKLLKRKIIKKKNKPEIEKTI